MSEHLPECPILKPCCDDEEFPEHGFCGNFAGRCLHCMAECICDALRACEERVLDDARKAVAALRGYFGAVDSRDGTVWLEKINALAAIDALTKEEQP